MLEPTYVVYNSAVLDASADAAWAELRDMMRTLSIVFGDGLEDARWLSGGSADKVPSLFEFTLLPNHDVAREEVVGRSELDRSLTYRTVAQVLSIVDYVATYRVKPVTNDPSRSFIEWDRQFRLVAGTNLDEFVPFVEALFAHEIAQVKGHFAAAYHLETADEVA